MSHSYAVYHPTCPAGIHQFLAVHLHFFRVLLIIYIYTHIYGHSWCVLMNYRDNMLRRMTEWRVQKELQIWWELVIDYPNVERATSTQGRDGNADLTGLILQSEVQQHADLISNFALTNISFDAQQSFLAGYKNVGSICPNKLRTIFEPG